MSKDLAVYYSDNKLTVFKRHESIGALTDYLEAMTAEEIAHLKFRPEEDTKSSGQPAPEGMTNPANVGQVAVPERVVDDGNNNYTIWSSTDFAEDDEQIPLVKIEIGDDGEPKVIKLSNGAFDEESAKIATNSLKSTAGRPLKDRLLRIDKSLNHSDPFFSTELQRLNIRANRGQEKIPIKKLTGGGDLDAKYPDTPRKEGEKTKTKFLHDTGVQSIANQVLMTNRDDLKAAANSKNASEESLAAMFQTITGVDYYTEKVVDDEQYGYLLGLMGRSDDKYDESHQSPEENGYIQGLKNLTEDLIEKVNLKRDPNFYGDKK